MPPIQSPSVVNALAISPDSRLVATGGQDGIVRLWDTASRRPVGTPVNVDGSYLFSVAFSPDGRLIAAGSEAGTVGVWEVATGRLLHGRPFAKLGASVMRVAFSRDGQLLAAGVYENDDTGSARVWRVRDGSPFGSPLTFDDPVRSVVFPPAGGLLAVAAGKSVRLWDPATGKAVGAPFTGHTDDVLCDRLHQGRTDDGHRQRGQTGSVLAGELPQPSRQPCHRAYRRRSRRRVQPRRWHVAERQLGHHGTSLAGARNLLGEPIPQRPRR